MAPNLEQRCSLTNKHFEEQCSSIPYMIARTENGEMFDAYAFQQKFMSRKNSDVFKVEYLLLRRKEEGLIPFDLGGANDAEITLYAAVCCGSSEAEISLLQELFVQQVLRNNEQIALQKCLEKVLQLNPACRPASVRLGLLFEHGIKGHKDPTIAQKYLLSSCSIRSEGAGTPRVKSVSMNKSPSNEWQKPVSPRVTLHRRTTTGTTDYRRISLAVLRSQTFLQIVKNIDLSEVALGVLGIVLKQMLDSNSKECPNAKKLLQIIQQSTLQVRVSEIFQTICKWNGRVDEKGISSLEERLPPNHEIMDFLTALDKFKADFIDDVSELTSLALLVRLWIEPNSVQTQNLREARNCLEKLVASDSENIFAVARLGIVLSNEDLPQDKIRALSLLEKAYHADKRNLEVALQLAKVLQQDTLGVKKSITRAEEIYKEILIWHKSSISAWRALGELNLNKISVSEDLENRKKHFIEARNAFFEALAINAEDFGANMGLGILLKDDAPIEAEVYFLAAEKRNPKDANLLAHYGDLLIDIKGRELEGEKLLGRAIELDPRNALALAGLGALARTGKGSSGQNRKLAIQLLDSAKTLSPRDERIEKRRQVPSLKIAQVEFDQKPSNLTPNRARDLCEAMLAESPRNVLLLIQMAEFLNDEAPNATWKGKTIEQVLLEAYKLQPKDSKDATVFVALIQFYGPLFEKGDFKVAETLVRYCSELLNFEPKNSEALDWLTKIAKVNHSLVQKGDLNAADVLERCCRKLLTIQTKSPEALDRLVCIAKFKKQKDPDKAQKLLEEVLSRDSKHVGALCLKATHLIGKDNPKAMQILMLCDSIEKNNVDVLFALGELNREKHAEQAKGYYERVLEIDPNHELARSRTEEILVEVEL